MVVPWQPPTREPLAGARPSSPCSAAVVERGGESTTGEGAIGAVGVVASKMTAWKAPSVPNAWLKAYVGRLTVTVPGLPVKRSGNSSNDSSVSSASLHELR